MESDNYQDFNTAIQDYLTDISGHHFPTNFCEWRWELLVNGEIHGKRGLPQSQADLRSRS